MSGLGRRDREIVRLRSVSYSTCYRGRLVVSCCSDRSVQSPCRGLVDATRYAAQPGHRRFGDGLVAPEVVPALGTHAIGLGGKVVGILVHMRPFLQRCSRAFAVAALASPEAIRPVRMSTVDFRPKHSLNRDRRAFGVSGGWSPIGKYWVSI